MTISARRRLLIVTPSFAPINSADSHRVRMSLPYYPEFGWEPTVLTVHPSYVEGARDSLLTDGLPENTHIIHTKALPVRATRRFGFRSLALRSLGFLAREGSRLLALARFDLVFFSSTAFMTFPLGMHWQRRFGVPYVLDYQDPWVSDYYRKSGIRPPGGKFKYAVSQLLGRVFEHRVLRSSSGIISVSPEYPKMLRSRYRDMREDKFSVIPFGAPERDFDSLAALNVRQHVLDRNDGCRHWVYVGVVGPIMGRSVTALFLALGRLREINPGRLSKLRLHFIGTDYASGSRAQESVQPIAARLGVGDLVEEQPQRIPYFEALQVMRDSDAVLMLGSDDRGYTASKVYPCILAKRPLLAIFHENSTVVNVLRSTRAGSVVTFGDSTTAEAMVPSLMRELSRLMDLPKDYECPTDWKAFAPYTARELTRAQCAVFDRAANPATGSSL